MHPKIQREQVILSRSRLFRLSAVLKVTTNPGANISGIDKITLETKEQKIKMVEELKKFLTPKYKTKPIKRVYIPKKSGKKRPLGIPIIRDRCLQALLNLVLEPLIESNSDTHSYGFRKYKSTKNAIGHLRNHIKSGGPEKKYILDGLHSRLLL